MKFVSKVNKDMHMDFVNADVLYLGDQVLHLAPQRWGKMTQQQGS